MLRCGPNAFFLQCLLFTRSLTAALIDEIKSAPEPVQRQVLDFLAFLKARHASADQASDDLLPLAQTAWAADWETPEEDEAWRDL
jgi:hypothetical protein